jgi:hypothetical protein
VSRLPLPPLLVSFFFGGGNTSGRCRRFGAYLASVETPRTVPGCTRVTDIKEECAHNRRQQMWLPAAVCLRTVGSVTFSVCTEPAFVSERQCVHGLDRALARPSPLTARLVLTRCMLSLGPVLCRSIWKSDCPFYETLKEDVSTMDGITCRETCA